MTGSEAWRIISSNLDELLRLRKAVYQDCKKPYNTDEIMAQVIAFEALRRMDENEGD